MPQLPGKSQRSIADGAGRHFHTLSAVSALSADARSVAALRATWDWAEMDSCKIRGSYLMQDQVSLAVTVPQTQCTAAGELRSAAPRKAAADNDCVQTQSAVESIMSPSMWGQVCSL